MGEPNTRKVIYEALRHSRGAEPEQKTSPWRRRLILGGSVFLALLIGVAALCVWYSLTHVSTARASVCAAVVSLSSDSDARTQELLVLPGQTVTRGQVLLKLDDSEARAAVAATEATRAIAEARVVSAQADLELRQARLPEEIRRAQAECQESAARLTSARAMAELYTADVAQAEDLVSRGYISRHDLDIERARLTTQRNTVREGEQTLAAREAALALIRCGEKEVDSMRAALLARQAELQRAEADVARAKAVLERMIIVSPVAGTVIRTFIHEGEICRRGTPVILVTDDSAGRWFEGMVREQDAADIKVGQSARVEMVVGSGDYVTATVENVALATSSLSRSDGSDINAARPVGSAEMVWVKLRPANLTGNPLPGMSASAVIRTR